MAIPVQHSLAKDLIDAVHNRLAHATDGWNPLLDAISSSYGVTVKHSIDFDGSGAGNYFRARLSAEGIDGASRRNYPTMTLFLESMEATDGQKRTTFYGSMVIGIDIFLSDDGSEPPDQFEFLKAAIMDSLSSLFGDIVDRSWFTDFNSNNDYAITTEALRFGAERWVEVVHFRMGFQAQA